PDDRTEATDPTASDASDAEQDNGEGDSGVSAQDEPENGDTDAAATVPDGEVETNEEDSYPEEPGQYGSEEERNAPLLDQTGNPIYQQLMTFVTWRSATGTADELLEADVQLADNVLTWQMPHGGFFKNGLERYKSPWNGSASRSDWTGVGGVELGTI